MKPFPTLFPRERGAAAIELALLLPILVTFLGFSLFWGRYFWHYTAAQKAAHDAARYLSTVSEQEMREPTLTPAAAALARGIALAEIEDLNPGRIAPAVIVLCGGETCVGAQGMALPATVSVTIRMGVHDIAGLVDFGRYGVPIEVTSEMRYVGN
ncbi:TadE/TadG family type IV pilus assembly protein [Massilia niastensis]|uniref:TadE/TadG family type IV pilus assembly protein n=1 Tax=Massilia niastensis TaxID=544911 RepID=UPI00036174F8|nr:TadE/TadG family type IV pilus assembly protein [Massilia niastensis]